MVSPATVFRMVAGDVQVGAQLRRGVVEYCVLALIAEQPTYGLAIARRLHESGLLESEGTLYPLLSRLRRRDLVVSTWEESAAGPPRRYYRLTPAGHAALREFRRDWQLFHTTVNALMGATDG